jgi:gamma-glutamyltranspeptidase
MRQHATWTAAQLLELDALGFTVRERSDAPYFGRINAIGYDAATRTFTGVSDPRWTGAAAAPQCSGACAPDPRR